jgi:tetratricopeptide (TPR) repeat protein
MRLVSRRRVFALAVLAVFSGLMLFASCLWADPIPNDPKSHTDATWKQDLLAHRMKEVQLYERNTKDPSNVRAAAIKFLEKAIRNDVLEWQHTPMSEALAKEAKRLVADGSNDPLVKCYLARVLSDVPSTKETKSLLISAIQGLAASSYPAEIQLRPVEWLRTLLVNTHESSAFQPYVESFVATSVRMLADAADRPQDRRVVWSLLGPFLNTNSPFFVPFQKSLREAVEKNQAKIDPWTFEMILGAYHVRQGWQERGGGYSVTSEGAKSFHEHLQQAAEHLDKAWKLDPKQPATPTSMIAVTMGGEGKGSPREWFDRAVAVQMDYEPAYTAILWAMRPRWGGSHEAMYDFGLECIATKRFDTIVPYQFIKAIDDTDEDLGGRGEAWRREGVYDNAKIAFEGLERDFPGKNETQAIERLVWLRSVHAVVAIRAEQFADARKTLEKMKDKDLRDDVFRKYGLTIPGSVARAFAMTGDGKDQVAKYEEQIEDEEPQTLEDCRAAAKLIEAAAAKDSSPRSKPYFDLCKKRLHWQELYHEGKWVSLDFDPQMLMWQPEIGHWTFESEHSIRGASEYEGAGFLMSCNAKFGDSFEIECDVEVLSTWGGYPPHSGIIVRAKPFSSPTYGTIPGDYFFWHRWPNNKFGACQWHLMKYEVEAVGKPKGHLFVRVWEDAWEFYADGLPFSPPGSVENFTPTGAIALSSPTWMAESGEARFSNVRIRKLTGPPAPPENEAEARIRYFTEALREHSDIPSYYFLRGVAHTNLGHFEEAVADLNKAKELRPAMADTVDWILGAAHENKGDYGKAIELYERVAKAHGDWSSTIHSLARVLATCPEDKYRNGAAAVKYATQACGLSKVKNWEYFGTLAAAHAEAGNFDEAVKVAKETLELAPDDQKDSCRERIELYQAKRPYRQPKLKTNDKK